MDADAPPTSRQLETLRRIAYASRRSFAWPSSRLEASQEIARIMRRRRRSRNRARLT